MHVVAAVVADVLVNEEAAVREAAVVRVFAFVVCRGVDDVLAGAVAGVVTAAAVAMQEKMLSKSTSSIAASSVPLPPALNATMC